LINVLRELILQGIIWATLNIHLIKMISTENKFYSLTNENFRILHCLAFSWDEIYD